MEVQIGDLVQFRQEKTNDRKCWSCLPVNYYYFKGAWKPLLAILEARDNIQAQLAWFPTWLSTETRKIPMIVMGFETRCFAGKSKLSLAQKALTRTFTKVMVFKQEGDFRTIPVTFWVLAEDIEGFKDKSYLDEFIQKLRQNLGEQKNSHEQK